MSECVRAAACSPDPAPSTAAFDDILPECVSHILLDSSAEDVTCLFEQMDSGCGSSAQQQTPYNSTWALPASTGPCSTVPLRAHAMHSPLGALASTAALGSMPVAPCDIYSPPTSVGLSACAGGVQIATDCTAASAGGFVQLMQSTFNTEEPTTATLEHSKTLEQTGNNSAAHQQCTSPNSTSSLRTFSSSGFSPTLQSGSESSDLLRRASALTAVAAIGASALPAPAALAAAQAKRKACNQASQRRIRQKRQHDADAAKEQLAAMAAKNAQLQEKIDSLRSNNTSLLNRLADVTSKWQATVVENAQLNNDNSMTKAQLAELMQQLAVLQREGDMLRYSLHQQQQLGHHAHHQPQQHHHTQSYAAMFQEPGLLQQQQQQQLGPGHTVQHCSAPAQWLDW